MGNESGLLDRSSLYIFKAVCQYSGSLFQKVSEGHRDKAAVYDDRSNQNGERSS